MGRILRPYSPLIYPGGRLPGFDPSHPAAGGISGGYGASAVVLGGGNFVDLLTGIGATKGGTVDTILSALIGPCAGMGHAGSIQTLTNKATVVDQSITIGVVLYFPINFVASGALFTSSNDATNGVCLRTTSAAASSTLQMIFQGKLNPIASSFSISSLTPYFIGATRNATTGYFVATNLQTGQIQSSGPNTATTTTPNASSGAYKLGSLNSGSFAAAMYSPQQTSLAALLAWAADPWAFWYPPARDVVLFSGLSGPVGGGTTTLTAAVGAFTETGIAATFQIQDGVAAGAFTETGVAALMVMALPVAAGAFTETGVAATFRIQAPEAAGTFAEMGVAAALTGILLGPVAGSFTETGVAATDRINELAAAGSFAETGNAAVLVILGATTGVVAATGSFIFTGIDAIELLSIGWRNANEHVTQWSSATKPARNWTVEAAPASPWSQE